MKEAEKFQQELEFQKTYIKTVLFADDKEVMTKAEDILEYNIYKLN